MDRILIQDLQVQCIIGMNEDERLRKQEVVINLALSTDLAPAALSDRMEDTVDYREIKKRIMAMAENSQFHLVEALAGAIASLCLEYPSIAEVQVRVEKPGALRFARTVGVEISRKRT
jgi:FolB domain-containing protein